MKSEKLVLLCARCNGEMSYVLASGPIRIQCAECAGKVEAAEKTIGLLRELLGRVG